MQKITTQLWFDKEAHDAAKLYTALFPNSEIKKTVQLHDTPSGNADFVTVSLSGQEFVLMNAGPYFKFTPAISFLVGCSTKEEVEKLYNELIKGGSALMELGEYPFSEKYGWIADTFGVTWQIMYMGDREIKQKITPTLMFVGDVCGKAEEAMNLYTSVFKNTNIGDIMRYPKGAEPDKEGTITHAQFTLEGQQFAAMDSAHEHKFNFTEAICFIINCEDQKEMDYFFEKLSAVPESEQCGWLKDKYGVSWQAHPVELDAMLLDPDQTKVDRVTQSFLKMKKLDLETLRKVYEGKE